MKLRFTLLCLSLLNLSLWAQPRITWLASDSFNYQLNPAMLPVRADASYLYVLEARMDSFALNYGSEMFGRYTLHYKDAETGAPLLDVTLGPKVLVTQVRHALWDHFYVAGYFMETLRIGDNDSLVNTGSGFDKNLFILKVDLQGQIVWYKNLSVTHPTYTSLSSLAVDNNYNIWYGASDFNQTDLHQLDAQGNELQHLVLDGGKMLGNFSFDAFGNIYIAGSCGQGPVNIAGLNANAPDIYNKFVARIRSNGQGHWVRFAHDITFEPGRIAAVDPFYGGAVMAGNLFDSLSWGSLNFNDPQWLYGIYVCRVDTLGNFFGALTPPVSPTITGDVQVGFGDFLQPEALLLNIRGTINWGNGHTSGSGAPSNNNLAVIFLEPTGASSVPMHEISSMANGYISAWDLCRNDNNYYFSSAITSPVDFQTGGQILSTNSGGGFAYMLGCIWDIWEGIEALQPELAQVFPIPSSGTLKIQSDKLISKVYVFNMLGQLALEASIQTNNTIDISSLAPATYLLVLEIEGKRFTTRIQKE